MQSHITTDIPTSTSTIPRGPNKQNNFFDASYSRRDSKRHRKRRARRYSVKRQILAFPVLPDSRPDERNRFTGHTLNISTSGLLMEASLRERPASNQLVICVEVNDGDWRSATLEVRRAETKGSRMQVACRFATPIRDLLRPENLTPTLQAETCRLHTRLPHDTLALWVSLGVLFPEVVDRILTCPECGAVPTFRRGCRGCGSPNCASERLIHHYACAHVARTEEFEQHDYIVCPKCRAKNLIVGADFEYLNSPFICGDCGWSDTDLELVGHCRVCHLCFPSSACPEEEVVGYHVKRLDPLVLIDAV